MWCHILWPIGRRTLSRFLLIYWRHTWVSSIPTIDIFLFFAWTMVNIRYDLFNGPHRPIFYVRAFSFYLDEKQKIYSQMTKCRNYIFAVLSKILLDFFLFSFVCLLNANFIYFIFSHIDKATDINDSNNTMHTNTLHIKCNKSHCE